MGRATPSRDELRRAADFRLALRRFHNVTQRVARAHGLTPRQYLLLLIVESSDSRRTTISELTRALHLVPSTMTGLLDRAEAAGVLVRSPAADDGRVAYVQATPEGRRRLRRAFRELADERRAVASSATPILE